MRIAQSHDREYRRRNGEHNNDRIDKEEPFPAKSAVRERDKRSYAVSIGQVKKRMQSGPQTEAQRCARGFGPESARDGIGPDTETRNDGKGVRLTLMPA